MQLRRAYESLSSRNKTSSLRRNITIFRIQISFSSVTMASAMVSASVSFFVSRDVALLIKERGLNILEKWESGGWLILLFGRNDISFHL